EDNVYSLEVVDNGNFDPETASYTWTGPENFDAPEANQVGLYTIEPTVPGTYTVTFVTPAGCVGTQEFVVLSTSCFVQRGISPGDGDKNNTFDLTALDVTSLSIF